MFKMALRTQTAATLLRSARLIPSRQAIAMAHRRFKSDDASSPTSLAEAPAAESTAPEERLPNSPDYGVHIDKATSYVLFTKGKYDQIYTVIDADECIM